MRKTLLSAFFISAMLSFPGVMSAETINPISEKSTDCKGTRSEENEDNSMNWILEYNDGLLEVTWVNYEANCCLEFPIRSWIEREDGNRLIFNIASDMGVCDCYCLYDETAEFEGIEPGHYTIVFREFSDFLTAEVDIEEGGRLVFPKSQSGIKTLSAKSDMMRVSSDGVLSVIADGKFTLEIFSSSGISQARIEGEQGDDISLASLPHGIYIARLSAAGRKDVIRFMK